MSYLPRKFSILVALFFACLGTSICRSQTPVSFQTEDGWTIHGDLYTPKNLGARKAPAVILLSEPGSTDRSMYDTYLGPDLMKLGITALAIDVRGSGGSWGKKEFEVFSPKEIDGLQLDIRAAIKFLASQNNVSSDRIGVVGPGITASYAVLEASEQPSIQAIVLISGTLNSAAREYIKFRSNLPILFLAGEKDKESFREMTEGYYLSASADSGFILGDDHGPVMFTHTAGMKERVAQWLADNVAGLGIERDVSFESKDGWRLNGVLRIPEGAGPQSPVPGVVLVHGARHDQQTFHDLARELVKRRLAVLTFDWRGKGRSTNEQKWAFTAADLAHVTEKDELGRVYLDVRAAAAFLASQNGVDGSRIGILGATLACGHSLRAAAAEPNVKAMVVLSCGEASEPEITQFLTGRDVPILVVAGLDDTHWDKAHAPSGSFAEDSRRIYLLSKSKYSQFLLYTRAGHGSEMFKVNPELQAIIVRWFTEKLDINWLKREPPAKQ